MEKEFLPYELALELKELGFNEESYAYSIENVQSAEDIYVFKKEPVLICYRAYDNKQDICAAPLYQQAFKWFREKHKLLGLPKPYGYEIQYNASLHYWGTIVEEETNTYEEAELACLVKLIKIAKNK